MVAPTAGDIPISDNKCIAILTSQQLKHESNHAEMKSDLNEYKMHGLACLQILTRQPHFNNLDKSLEISQTMNNFYSKLLQRESEQMDSVDNKVKFGQMMSDEVATENDNKINAYLSEYNRDEIVIGPSSSESASSNYGEQGIKIHAEHSGEHILTQDRRHRRATKKVKTSLLQISKINDTTHYLIEKFNRVWITSAHLALICKCFPESAEKKTTHFGSFRVELVVALYPRVVDTYNIGIVLAVLNGFEVGCLYCRVGILNLFNPLNPDNFYILDLSYYDTRLVAKVLTSLAVVEPGDNW